MKIAVIGGRDFNDYSALAFIVSEYKPSMLISGGAKGADSLAEKFSRDFGTPIKVYRANWNDFTPPCRVLKHKRGGQMYNALAGMNRNTKIIEDSIFHALEKMEVKRVVLYLRMTQEKLMM